MKRRQRVEDRSSNAADPRGGPQRAPETAGRPRRGARRPARARRPTRLASIRDASRIAGRGSWRDVRALRRPARPRIRQPVGDEGGRALGENARRSSRVPRGRCARLVGVLPDPAHEPCGGVDIRFGPHRARARVPTRSPGRRRADRARGGCSCSAMNSRLPEYPSRSPASRTPSPRPSSGRAPRCDGARRSSRTPRCTSPSPRPRRSRPAGGCPLARRRARQLARVIRFPVPSVDALEDEDRAFPGRECLDERLDDRRRVLALAAPVVEHEEERERVRQAEARCVCGADRVVARPAPARRGRGSRPRRPRSRGRSRSQPRARPEPRRARSSRGRRSSPRTRPRSSIASEEVAPYVGRERHEIVRTEADKFVS